MEIKYIQGPWEIDDELPPNARNVIARTTGRIPISENVLGPQNEGEGKDRAIARLIAAAPELLEACKELIRDINRGSTPNQSNPCYLMANAAITKATNTREHVEKHGGTQHQL